MTTDRGGRLDPGLRVWARLAISNMMKMSSVVLRGRVARFRIVGAAMIFAATAALSPGALHAQSYLAALVTPPRSVGTCQATRAVSGARPDARPYTGHRLVIPGSHHGDQRQITVFVGTDHTMLYDDVALSMPNRISRVSAGVLASVDSVHGVRGRRFVRQSFVSDSLLETSRDTAALNRMMAASEKPPSYVTLTAAEQARVRTMAAWLLKRCP